MCAASLYNAIVVFFKLSILSFYRRIFPQVWFFNLLIITAIWVVATGVTFIFTAIFQCIPVASQWDPLQAVGATCIDFGTVILVGGVINSVNSIFILLLPVPLVWQLQISAQKKRLIIFLFGLGGG